MSEVSDNPLRVFVPPTHRLYRDFLDADTHADLVAWTMENEAEFEPTRVADGKYDPSVRSSLGVSDFGPTVALLRQRVLDLVPTLIKDLRVSSFEPSDVEVQLVSSNDGSFFRPHIDTFIADRRKATDRLVSAVYYFYTEPKAFTGGALRLYPFGAKEGEGNFVDIEPEQNMLIAFPSWAMHEVLPVICPSRRFADSRFNVNCWVLRSSTKTVT